MGISGTLYGWVLASLEAACAGEDRRRVRSLGWLVTGLLLEQDARLSRIALAMGLAASAASRQRQLLRLLDSGLDLRLPPRLERMLKADRGFQHLELLAWCHQHGWLYRIRAKSQLGVRLPDGTEGRLRAFNHRLGLTPGEQWIPGTAPTTQ